MSTPGPALRKSRLVTAARVAEALEVSIHWVYRAAKSCDMPHYRIGRYVRFDLEEVIAWVREGNANIY